VPNSAELHHTQANIDHAAAQTIRGLSSPECVGVRARNHLLHRTAERETTSCAGNWTAAGLLAWENAAGTPIFGASDPDGTVDGADEMAPDGKNEILFASIAEPGTVAVTIVWGVFSGPPFGRELVEWDMVLDSDLT
jgi:hypothetical protein